MFFFFFFFIFTVDLRPESSLKQNGSCAQRRFWSALASTQSDPSLRCGCLGWSESSLSAWRKLGSLPTNRAHSEDSDQTGRMPRLIRVFFGRSHFVGFALRQLITGVNNLLQYSPKWNWNRTAAVIEPGCGHQHQILPMGSRNQSYWPSASLMLRVSIICDTRSGGIPFYWPVLCTKSLST